ncbi:unnamed protein product [Linum tenue]|uniref:RBR-type E3 ubiquitin transferase n=1 Tax=Linum tenue TaxID=586396 RepID=A0AAV0K0H0_9ROSI|nr:unnamed protein product [Linum tenue]
MIIGSRTRWWPRTEPNSCSSPKPAKWPFFVCNICFETSTHDPFNPKGCDHVYCTPCTAKYIDTKLSDNKNRILCPSPGCNGLLDPDHCRRILPQSLLDRWEASLAESAIDDAHKLYCPYPDCSALLINDGGGGCRPGRWLFFRRLWRKDWKANCPWCRRAFCVRCRVPWHSRMDCGKYQRSKAKREDKMVVELAKANRWKRCPGCRMYVSKQSGCSHIICRCRAEFCYICGARYSIEHRCRLQ